MGGRELLVGALLLCLTAGVAVPPRFQGERGARRRLEAQSGELERLFRNYEWATNCLAPAHRRIQRAVDVVERGHGRRLR